jgi:sphingolipid delta-4 desaturase
VHPAKEAVQPEPVTSESSYPSTEESNDEDESVVKSIDVGVDIDVHKSPMKGDAPPAEADFLWMYTEEPHRSRRMAILKAHPEVSLNEGALGPWLSDHSQGQCSGLAPNTECS